MGRFSRVPTNAANAVPFRVLFSTVRVRPILPVTKMEPFMPKFIVESFENSIVTLRVPGSNYRNSFVFNGDPALLTPGTRVRGTIHAPAWKVDRVELGGNYVEPLYGRPRRMQGTILSVNTARNELTVQVGYEATVKLPAGDKADTFKPGERVGWDNIEIPTFALEAAVPAPALH
jgi:hypothetical protein